MAQSGAARLGKPPRVTDTRGHILPAAAGVFARKGFDGASMEEIAAAVGSSKAAIYHYFDGKWTIYNAIIIEPLEAVVAALVEAIGEEPTAEGKIAAYFDTHIRFQQRWLDAITVLVQ